MRRTPVVISATVAGLVAVLSFQPRPQGPLAGLAPPTPAATRQTSAPARRTATARVPTAHPATVTGRAVPNQYGTVQVRVTAVGRRITAVSPVQLPQGDPQSSQISTVAAPKLRQQALAAQSARIDGVSGASYTSEGYQASLQSAIDALPSAPRATA